MVEFVAFRVKLRVIVVHGYLPQVVDVNATLSGAQHLLDR